MSAQLYPTLSNAIDCSCLAPLSMGVLQARILVAIPFSRGSPWPRDQAHISCIGRSIHYHLYTGCIISCNWKYFKRLIWLHIAYLAEFGSLHRNCRLLIWIKKIGIANRLLCTYYMSKCIIAHIYMWIYMHYHELKYSKVCREVKLVLNSTLVCLQSLILRTSL